MAVPKTTQIVKGFFLPELNARYVLRVLVVALVAFVIFKFVAAPFYIRGDSMAPTYRSGGFVFGWRLAWLFSEPERGDVVIIRLAGTRVALLKRIVGLPGETVEFRGGYLFVNGVRLEEPYVKNTGGWHLGPRVVEEGHYYVVGDNRGGRIEDHVFGRVERERIIGTPLW